MALVPVCNGTTSVTSDDAVTCSVAWDTVDLQLSTSHMTAEEFSDLWPLLMLMFISAWGIRILVDMVNVRK